MVRNLEELFFKVRYGLNRVSSSLYMPIFKERFLLNMLEISYCSLPPLKNSSKLTLKDYFLRTSIFYKHLFFIDLCPPDLKRFQKLLFMHRNRLESGRKWEKLLELSRVSWSCPVLVNSNKVLDAVIHSFDYGLGQAQWATKNRAILGPHVKVPRK